MDSTSGDLPHGMNDKDREAVESLILLSRHQPVPTLHRSPVSFRNACSLLGCNLACELSGQYCCESHQRMATQHASQKRAFHFFDGFVDGDHRTMVCSACLILQGEGTTTGIPTLEDETIFSTKPWELSTFLTSHEENPDINTDWLFFQNPPEKFTSMDPVSKLYWKANKRKRIIIEDQEIDITLIYLRFDDGKSAKTLHRGWKLFLFKHKKLSLYCLSHSLTKVSKSKVPPTENEDHLPVEEGTTQGIMKKSRKNAKESSEALTDAEGTNFSRRGVTKNQSGVRMEQTLLVKHDSVSQTDIAASRENFSNIREHKDVALTKFSKSKVPHSKKDEVAVSAENEDHLPVEEGTTQGIMKKSRKNAKESSEALTDAEETTGTKPV